MADEARRSAERAARFSRGRLLAYLAARTRDVAAAEDALAEAFARALEIWPRDGVPVKPEAWLLTVARHRLADLARHGAVKDAAEPTLRLIGEAEREIDAFPDDRLKLLFVCAHPAIDEGARTPLMLQTVLGLDAARIASAFLVAPSAMGQRLVRAKAKIRAAGIAFVVPEAAELPERLETVLEAIYAAYGSGWGAPGAADARQRDLAEEAIDLARLVTALLPRAETFGLLALLLHCEARRRARRTADGRFVPLEEQDIGLWSRPLIVEANRLLARAADQRSIGRFQVEAGIQAMHARRLFGEATDWLAIADLHAALVRLHPTVGALVGQAAALGEGGRAGDGLAVLDVLTSDTVSAYQPYWATRAHLLRLTGAVQDAAVAYERAIGLSEDPAVRAFLQTRRATL